MLRPRAWLRGASIASLLVVAVLCSHCAPAPETVRCRNDAVCRDLGGDFHYCYMSHCVECVTHAACGRDRSCIAGVCRTKE